MQALFNFVTLFSLLKLGSIQAVPVGVREVERRDVDLTDPVILREDIDDLTWLSEHSDLVLHSYINNNIVAIQTQIDSLSATVRTLQESVTELVGWRANSEEQLRSMGRNIREGLQEVTGNLHLVNDRVMTVEDVILQHHLESYRQLGYTLNEDASGFVDTEGTSTPTTVPSDEPDSVPITGDSAGSGSVVLPL